MLERKPGWVYVDADNLVGVEYAIKEDGSEAYFADGVRYTRAELERIKKSPLPIDVIHKMKKIFDGEIVFGGEEEKQEEWWQK
jgi:hypothetical protein